MSDPDLFARFRSDNPELRPSETDWPLAYDVATDDFRAATQDDITISILVQRQMREIFDLLEKQKAERAAFRKDGTFPPVRMVEVKRADADLP